MIFSYAPVNYFHYKSSTVYWNEFLNKYTTLTTLHHILLIWRSDDKFYV